MGSPSKQPAARLGDIDTGHPPAPPTPIITASGNVFINGIPAARITDAINCGGTIVVGSGNVLIGDTPPSGSPLAPGEWQDFIDSSIAAGPQSAYQSQQMRADTAVKYRGKAAGNDSWKGYYSDVAPKDRPAPASVQNPTERTGLEQANSAKPDVMPALPPPQQQQVIDNAGQQMQNAIANMVEGEMVTPEMLNLASTMMQAGASSVKNKQPTGSSAPSSTPNMNLDGGNIGFKTLGIVVDPKTSQQGRLLMQQYRQQYPDMSPVEIQRLARTTLETGDALPVISIAKPGDKFYKLIPTNEARGPSPGTVYWMDASQLDNLMRNQINIGSSFGLPNKTTASTYNVFEVTVKEAQAPLVFRSKIAPVIDDGVKKEGGQNQAIIPKRSAFSQPVKLLDNSGNPLQVKSG